MAYKKTCPVLAKVSDDEPIFVLRAQDKSAPRTIAHWLMLNPQLSNERQMEARNCIEAMQEWPKRKVAD